MRRLISDPKIVNEILRIKRKNGEKLHPETVVDEARKTSSPLHNYFEWDNTEAARQYRIWQARDLIRCVVTLIRINDEERVVNVFVSLCSDRGEGGYRLIADVLNKSDLRKEMLQDALDDMKRFEQKYKDLVELSEVFASFRQIRQKFSEQATA